MSDSCEDCLSQWAEGKYWSTSPRRFRFCQFLHGDFHKQLPIPDKFFRHMERKLPDIVFLEDPSGQYKWKVGLTIHEGKLFFEKGWEEFVKHHLLRENDLLFFTYEVDTQFCVTIIDGKSLCEKESSHYVIKCEHTTHKECGRRTKRKMRENSCDQEVEARQMGAGSTSLEKSKDDKTESFAPSNETSDDGSLTLQQKRHLTSLAKAKKFRLRSTTSSRVVKSKCGTNTNKRRIIPEDERIRVMDLAVKAKKFESFIVEMKRTHIYHFRLGIPKEWRREYLSGENQKIVLRVGQKSWHTNFYFEKTRSEGFLSSSGWKYFVKDNKLEEFDVCVFSPSQCHVDKFFTLDAQIFRVEQLKVTRAGS